MGQHRKSVKKKHVTRINNKTARVSAFVEQNPASSLGTREDRGTARVDQPLLSWKSTTYWSLEEAEGGSFSSTETTDGDRCAVTNVSAYDWHHDKIGNKQICKDCQCVFYENEYRICNSCEK